MSTENLDGVYYTNYLYDVFYEGNSFGRDSALPKAGPHIKYVRNTNWDHHVLVPVQLADGWHWQRPEPEPEPVQPRKGLINYSLAGKTREFTDDAKTVRVKLQFREETSRDWHSGCLEDRLYVSADVWVRGVRALVIERMDALEIVRAAEEWADMPDSFQCWLYGRMAQQVTR